MRPVLVIAIKEFKDLLTSKRFIALLFLLILLSGFCIVTGMNKYNTELNYYKASLTESQKSGALVNPTMPSPLIFFWEATEGNSAGVPFGMILALLSLALGFDLITREKMEGSLKSLLSHPVFRDEVINGKLIGGILTLVVAIFLIFLFTLAFMLFYGVIPSADDLLRLIVYFVMALLYVSVILAIAMLISTVTNSSTTSILCVLGVLVAFCVIPSFYPNVVNAILGPAPQLPQMSISGGTNTSSGSSTTSEMAANNSEAAYVWAIQHDTAYKSYWDEYGTIYNYLNVLSPCQDFAYSISQYILYPESEITEQVKEASTGQGVYVKPTLLDSLGQVWINIVALIVWLIVPVAITYIMFMRMDVR